MKIHYSFDNFGKIKNPVVTTGTFDGVHVGHQKIIKRLSKLAENIEVTRNTFMKNGLEYVNVKINNGN